MAGGVFSKQNKIRPGAYINTVPNITSANDNGDGVVLLANASNLGWGKNGTITLDQSSNFNALLGTNINDDSLAALRETLKTASAVKLVNSNKGNKASLNISSTPWNVTANYGGTKGNNITVNVINSIADSSKVNVQTIFNDRVIDNQLISKNNATDIEDNSIVSFTTSNGTVNVDSTSGGSLSGGTDVQDDITTLLGEALQKETFDVATTAGFGENDQIHAVLSEMINDLRNQEGYKVTAVVPAGSNNFNTESTSVIANGVTLADGTNIDKTIATGYYAGLSATASLSQSLTYTGYIGAAEAYPQLSNDATINALKNGKIVFSQLRSEAVVIEQDINSAYRPSGSIPSTAKNKVLRTIDYFENDTKTTFENSFIGKVANNGTGRSLFAANRLAELRELEKNGVVENVQNNDISIDKGDASDSIVVNAAVKPVDSIEKLYMTVFVQ